MVDPTRTPPEHFWYFVGLITSDGCLYQDGRHINLVSKDLKYLEALKRTLQILNKIGSKVGGTGSLAFQIQMCNKRPYNHLLEVGLKPKKSLILGPLNVAIRGIREASPNPRYEVRETSSEGYASGVLLSWCLAMARKLERVLQCINTPNGVRKYGNVVAGVAKPENARRLNRRGRKRP